jgi:hypothetical protein
MDWYVRLDATGRTKKKLHRSCLVEFGIRQILELKTLWFEEQQSVRILDARGLLDGVPHWKPETLLCALVAATW